MTGFDASVLNSPKLRLLVIVPNWLGDGIMAMPALQTLRAQLHPEAQIFVGARPGQCGLWEMQPAVSKVIPLPAGNEELFASAKTLKALHCQAAVILPHSFRSALIPALAKIPTRRGTAHQCGRRLLIRDPVSLAEMEDQHQQWEIARLLLPGSLPPVLPAPLLEPPEEAFAEAAEWLSPLSGPILGCIPGAARGPSKQWPGERFQAVAQAWVAHTQGGVCWLGTPADEALCEELNRPLGGKGLSLAGKTGLKSFTALLSKIDKALVNDSGGMHLAAAVGTPLVAVFGNTDPAKTGPLSPHAVVIQHSDQRNRSIDRKSDDAKAALERVGVEEVLQPLLANPVLSS
ncbi:lipopolysaccharide heptosyltransferase II [Kiritimatiellaeota bacterium B1221]|nr:lipopolysaccharide heptosyltransferase II [Kiritimatiellaeota bacterium B1221]